jgi:hypothetical protein
MENGLGAAALRPQVPPDRWLFLRYEDFATHPRASISRILAFFGEDGAPPFVADDSAVLDVNHTVAGNLNWFRVGRVKISLDDEWSRRMPRHRQLLVRALTWAAAAPVPPFARLTAQVLPSTRLTGLPSTPLTARFTRWAFRTTGSAVRTRR